MPVEFSPIAIAFGILGAWAAVAYGVKLAAVVERNAPASA